MGTIPPRPPVIRPIRSTSYRCEYCTRRNDIDRQFCEGCGAPKYLNNGSIPSAIITLPTSTSKDVPTWVVTSVIALFWLGIFAVIISLGMGGH